MVSTSTKKGKKFGGIFVQIGLLDGGMSSLVYCEWMFSLDVFNLAEVATSSRMYPIRQYACLMLPIR